MFSCPLSGKADIDRLAIGGAVESLQRSPKTAAGSQIFPQIVNN